jgi:hypothetical protein
MMKNSLTTLFVASTLWAAISAYSSTANADPFTFSTGDPDGLIATGSRPSSPGKVEIESADDFILTQSTQINHATFTGLLTSNATVADISNIVVEIYRIFPKDSQNPPPGNVPTRVNSPSDVEFDSRDAGSLTLNFSANILNNNFTVANSVLDGINPSPNQQTGGEGSVSGQEVKFDVTFTTPFSLPADHYFFIPQVEMSIGNFLWLSAPKPITSGTGPFVPDLQSWIRNDNLAPDWLRVGTDIIGGTAFNAAFSLDGQTSSVPEPGTIILFSGGLAALFARRRDRTAL